MASFSPTDAAFEGFRLTREQPRAVLLWWAAFFVFNTAIALLGLWWLGPDRLAQLTSLQQMASQDPDSAQRLFSQNAPFLLVAATIQALFYAVINTAIFRAVLRPEDRKFGALRFGADEARMAVIAVAYLLLWFVALFAIVVLAGVALAVGSLGGSQLSALLSMIVGLAAVCGTVWVFVRLSLAGPMTFQTRRFMLIESWAMTRGLFWRLAGTYVLSFLFGLIVLFLLILILSMLIQIAVSASGGALSGLRQTLNSDAKTIGGFFSPFALLSQVYGTAMITAFYVIVLSPLAIIYRALTR